jgi:hypothetical protein
MLNMLDIISSMVSNIWLAWDIWWQLDMAKEIYNQFVIYSQSYHASGVIPTDKVIEEFTQRVNGLKVVQEYCSNNLSQSNIVEIIKAYSPFEEIEKHCRFPEGLTEDVAKQFVNPT